MSSKPHKTLIIVAGPTAIGKTAAAIQLAKHFNSSILSADSRQFYREMSIGTAKPTPAEQAEARHYFINSHSVTDKFTVGDFEKQALAVLDEIFKNNNVAVMAGGSGLFIKAVCEGFDELPTADPGIREKLNNLFAEQGIKMLQEKLKAIDPRYYAQVDVNNPQRLIRALEVYETTGQPFSSYRTGGKVNRPFNIVKIGLNMPREQLYNRINQRVDEMIKVGLLEEVKLLLPYRNLNPLNTVGYSELFDHLDAKTDLATAIDLIKQHTRQFAKRQLTWFNKDKQITWINPLTDDIVEVAKRLITRDNSIIV